MHSGEARNKGIENSDFELISFIDLKTLPKSDWLEDALVHFKISLWKYCLAKEEELQVITIKD